MTEISEDETLHSKIDAVKLVPSGGGRFEVSLNDELIYSKAQTGRHAEPGEVYALLKEKLV